MNRMICATGKPARAALACLALALTACNARDAVPSAAGDATQVVAKVNGSELTLSQLNLLLNRSTGGAADAAGLRAALNELVREELLVQQATADKLDRDPDVMLRMEEARRQVLADAYAAKRIYASQPVADAELRAYYDAHPELFSARRMYTIAAFVTDQRQLNQAVMAELSRAHDEATLRDLLTRNGVGYHVERLQEGADDLPLDLAPVLAAAVPGKVLQTTHDAGARVALFLVLDAVSSPMKFEQARSTIENYLAAQRSDRALAAWVESARRGARIEYLGKLRSVANATESSSVEAGLKGLN